MDRIILIMREIIFNFQLSIFSFLCLALPLMAQSEEDEVPRSINESTMVGVGSYNLRDTYVASFTDAWIETKSNFSINGHAGSHPLRMRGLKLFVETV